MNKNDEPVTVSLMIGRVNASSDSGVVPLRIAKPRDGEEPNCWLSVARGAVYGNKDSAEYWEDWETGGRERSRDRVEQARIDKAEIVNSNKYDEQFVFCDDYMHVDSWLDGEGPDVVWATKPESLTFDIAGTFADWWHDNGPEDCSTNDWPESVHTAIDAAQQAIDANKQTVLIVDYSRRVVRSNADQK